MTLTPLYYYSDYVSKIVLLLYGAYVYAYIHQYLIFRVLYIEYSLFGEHAQGMYKRNTNGNRCNNNSFA